MTGNEVGKLGMVQRLLVDIKSQIVDFSISFVLWKKSLDPIVYEATIATNDAEKQDPQCLKIAKKYLI